MDLLEVIEKGNSEEAAEKAYFMLYGEKEARAVQSRLRLSLEERLQKPLDYEEGAIMKNDNIQKRNSAEHISSNATGASDGGFVAYLQSYTRRGVQTENQGGTKLQGSGIPANKINYSLATDGIANLDDLTRKYGEIPQGENSIKLQAIF